MSPQQGAAKLAAVLFAALYLTGCPDRAPPPVAVTPAEAQESTESDPASILRSIGDSVYFDYDSFELQPDAQRTLQQQAAFLQANGDLAVVIEGHCDERGTREYNLALGERRAATIKQYLTALGIDSGRIETVSFGKERPEATGDEEAFWALNRRGVTALAGN